MVPGVDKWISRGMMLAACPKRDESTSGMLQENRTQECPVHPAGRKVIHLSTPGSIGSTHVRAFLFFGGLTKIVVPDNLRSAVSKPCRYEPQLNRSYHDLSTFYNIAVIPARVRKPKDKAKVEAGVQLVQRWILAVLELRGRTKLTSGNCRGVVTICLVFKPLEASFRTRKTASKNGQRRVKGKSGGHLRLPTERILCGQGRPCLVVIN